MSRAGAMHREALFLERGRSAVQPSEGDEELAERARKGDTVAFEQLYLRHRDYVYKLCLNLCGHRDQAQDLLQETFIRAYRALPRFRGGSRFTTWLHRIASNLCWDAAQRREAIATVDPPPPAIHQGWETVEEVRAALARLKPQQRAALALHYGQGLSYQEIAELLNWSLSKVKVTMHRAKRAFREVYEGVRRQR